MKKRILASILAATLCLSLLPYEVLADMQGPVKSISKNSIVGHDEILGQTIRPKVRLSFEEPDPTKRADPSPDVIPADKEAAHDGERFHYQVKVDEYSGRKSFSYPRVPTTLEVLNRDGGTEGAEIAVEGLENGMLYQMSIIPFHEHKYSRIDNEGRVIEESRWAPRTNISNPDIYVLTDFDTRVEGEGGSLEVTWEDPGYADMQYQIGYVQGNYAGQSLEDIRKDATSNNMQYITSEDIAANAKRYWDDATDRYRFRYIIEKDIAMGQMYSVYVVAAENQQAKNKIILQNRKTPRVVTATTEIGLSAYNVGKDKIRLEWDAQIINALAGEYKLEKTEIKEYGIGQVSGRTIATLYGEEGAKIGYYEYREPKESTHYQLIFTYKKGDQTLTPKTPKVLYVPGQLRIKPTTPEIPRPVGPSTDISDANKSKFLVPGDQLPDVPNIDFWKNDRTFHANMTKPPTLNFVWSAYQGDDSLLYDIVVTDDIGIATADIAPIVKDLTFSDKQNEKDILYSRGTEEILGFKHTLREYYNADGKKLPLVPNKVYYVKIIAKKAYGDQLESSLPAIVTIMFDSDGEEFAPPTISKPPLLLDPTKIGTTAITLGWLESWHEIMAKKPQDYPEQEREKAKEWNAEVYTGTTSAAIAFVNKEGAKKHVLKHKTQLELVKTIVGHGYKDNYIDRLVDLGKNVQYEYKFIPYQDILIDLEAYNASSSNKKTVEEYIEMLMQNETDPEQDYGWTKITPTKAEDQDGVEWRQHTQDKLKPNTSYVFFIKPYRNDYDGTKLQASLPTWVVGTTLPDGEMEEGKPTVPTLSLNGKGDTHISVEWEYNSAFDYEIRYSRLEDPETASPWPFEIGKEIGDPNYVEHGGKAVVTIDGLFPETTYNVWIRAKQKKGNQLSAWSNPVTTKTDILGAPTSPAGLGIASYQSILEVGRDFKAVDSNHITVEWERNAPDKDLDNTTQDSQRVEKEYRYVVEIADNPEFIDKQRVTVGKDTVGAAEENSEILSRSMVYFDNLVANRPYYVRAKTILIAHDRENDREIIKESAYAEFVRIITKPSQDEYDGGDKMNEVIYPNKIEESYDGQTWTYEIMDTQKVINEMVTGNQFRYVVPVQLYRGRYDPKYRVIRMPQPLVTTLLSRRMELEIRTNILSIQIPAKALEAAMLGTSADGMVEFAFETLSGSDLYQISKGYEFGFLFKPERMTITVKGQKGIKALKTVDALMKVKINMPHQHDYMHRNLAGYTYDDMIGKWQQGNHQFDKINMQLEYTTGSIGTYAVYEKTRVPTVYESMSSSMANVVKKHDIIGLGTTYTPNMRVNSSEYIKIMLGIAEKKPQIKPEERPTNAEINRVKNAGLYIGDSNSPLTQEAAISGVIKLYELTHGISVRPQTDQFLGFVSPNYRNNIRKAYTIGLVDSINPGQSISYEQLFNLIEQVIE